MYFLKATLRSISAGFSYVLCGLDKEPTLELGLTQVKTFCEKSVSEQRNTDE